MARKKAITGPQAITVRLDHRTIVTLSNSKSLAFWRKRYPNLTIIPKPQ